MSIDVRRNGSYPRNPWKNGQGFTEDVLMLPEGSGHDDFDIRLSLAPIVADGPFSAFPGIDRTITLVGGSAFAMDFGAGRVHRLETLEPFRFDSAQAPVTRIGQGEARVFNVMARASLWQPEVRVIRGGEPLSVTVPPGGLAILHAVSGSWTLATAAGTASAATRDTAIVDGVDRLDLDAPAGCAAVFAVLAPRT